MWEDQEHSDLRVYYWSIREPRCKPICARRCTDTKREPAPGYVQGGGSQEVNPWGCGDPRGTYHPPRTPGMSADLLHLHPAQPSGEIRSGNPIYQ